MLHLLILIFSMQLWKWVLKKSPNWIYLSNLLLYFFLTMLRFIWCLVLENFVQAKALITRYLFYHSFISKTAKEKKIMQYLSTTFATLVLREYGLNPNKRGRKKRNVAETLHEMFKQQFFLVWARKPRCGNEEKFNQTMFPQQCFLGIVCGVFRRLKYCTSEWINLVMKARKPRPDLPKVRKFRVVLKGVKILILCSIGGMKMPFWEL